MVPGAGVEPARYFYRGILSFMGIVVSTLRLHGDFLEIKRLAIFSQVIYLYGGPGVTRTLDQWIMSLGHPAPLNIKVGYVPTAVIPHGL
jgi:hypothetical protein